MAILIGSYSKAKAKDAEQVTVDPTSVMMYLGLVDVEANLLGLVFGVTVNVSLGLLTVALCHYLGIARRVVTTPLIPYCTWA